MLLLVALLASAAMGQSLKVGDPAPGLVLERTIPTGMRVNWTDLRAKPVVLEFWATWCANCVAEIPHLNELASQFQTVQFIAVTDEAFSVVEPFLAKLPIQGWVGLDLEGATFKKYGVEARPRTVLIDSHGVIQGIMHPAQVDAAVLSDLVAGRAIKPNRLPAHLRILEGATSDPVFALMLRPSNSAKPGGVFNVDPGRIEGNNIALKTIIAYACSVGERRLEGPAVPLSTRYDFCALLPDGVTGDVELLRVMLERSFKLKLRREPRVMDAVVLKLIGDRPQEQGGAGQMSVLASVLEARFDRVVLDETGLKSYKLFELPKTKEELSESLRSRLGVALSLERRTVDVLVVESLELPKFRMGAPGR